MRRYATVALLFLVVGGEARARTTSASVPRIVISHVTVVDVVNRRLIPDQDIDIVGEKIAAIGSLSPLPAGAAHIDGSHLVALPGFVDTHTHLWQHVAKSVAPSGMLQEWIPQVYGVADYLTDQELYDVTLAAASQALLSGITTVVDFSSVNYQDRAVPTTMKAVRDAGVDGVVIWWDPAAFLPPDVKEEELRALNQRDPEHIQVWVGPGPLSFFPLPSVNSAIMLARAAGTRIAEHTMENVQEQRDFADRGTKYLQKYAGRIAPDIADAITSAIPATPMPAVDGLHALRRDAESLLAADDAKRADAVADSEQRMLSAADRQFLATVATTSQPSPLIVLDKLRALPGFLSIHSVWLGDRDIDLLKRNAASVSLNPESNMYLSSGAAPLLKYLQEGVNVTIGTDGAASNDGIDFFSAMRAAWDLQKVHALDTEVTGGISAWDILDAATINGARAIGCEQRTGSIEVGKQADLTLLSTDRLGMTPFREATAASLIVNSAGVRDVQYVISNGVVVVKDGHLTSRNEAQLSRRLTEVAENAFARSAAGKTWKDDIAATVDRALYRSIRKRDSVDVRVTNGGASPVVVTLGFSGTTFGGTAAPVLRPEALKSTPLDAPKAYSERSFDLAPQASLSLTKDAGEPRYTIQWPGGKANREMPEREQVFIRVAAPNPQPQSLNLTMLPLAEYAARVASTDAAPGGGSAAASTALLGTSMIVKAIRISTKSSAAGDLVLRSLENQTRIITSAVDEDAMAFQEYLRASRMPKETDEQRERRAPILAAARQHALAVPLATGHALQEIAQLAIDAAPLCKDSLLSDLTGGAMLVQASAHAALLNVAPNLTGESDSRRAEIIAERDAIASAVDASTQRLLVLVAQRQH